jgi:hypothetical protein
MKGLIFLKKNPKLPWTVFVGAAGMPGKRITLAVALIFTSGYLGKTAFMGWKEFSRAKKVRTLLLSNFSS